MRSGTLRRLVGMGWCLAFGVSLHPAHGQTASLVTDLTPGEAAGAGTNPLELFPAGTHVFFSAEDGPGGSALWVTDGTAAGTQRLPPSESLGPGFLAAVGNLAFFTTGDRLWRTDGTRAGTLALAEVHLGAAALLGKLLYYTTYSSSSGAISLQLWRSDGTVAGTFMVAQLATLPPATSGSSPRPTSRRC